MEGPDLEIRELVASRARELGAEGNESGLDGLLETIQGRIATDLEGAGYAETEDAPYLLAAVESWASVTSDALVRFYGPESPLKQSLAGWATRISYRLHEICSLLLHPLAVAAKAMGAIDFSIGANFPWGVSVSLSWPAAP